MGNIEEVENHCGFTTTMGERTGRGSGKILPATMPAARHIPQNGHDMEDPLLPMGKAR